MGIVDKPETAEDISIVFPEDKEADARTMLKNNEQAWSGHLVEISVTEMPIDLTLDSIPSSKDLSNSHCFVWIRRHGRSSA